MRFRNFIRQPDPVELFGSTLGQSRDRPQRIRRLMCGLARQMALAYDWPEPIGPGTEPWENPDVPSGYTYLAQFVAHDCVFTSVPTGALSAIGAHIDSRRSALLQLETLYGGGPDASPHAYVPEGQNNISRKKLLTGRAALRGVNADRCPLRDFGRATAINRDRHDKEGLTSALVSDPRNDVHAAIAQLTMLLHSLHNKVATLVERAAIDSNDTAPDIRGYRTYFVARAICVRVYHNLVRNDLLPRLLHPRIVDAYTNPAVEFLDPQPLDALPSEFAHVLRFGHAMVRHNYVFNDFNNYGEDLVDMMLATSASRPWRMPLDDTWIAQWSHFFDISSHKPNWSRRIGPSMSGGLFSGEIFGAVDETGSVGLPYRDLLSSGFVPQWSVTALAREIRTRRPWIAALSPLLSDDGQRTHKIGDWLGRHRAANGMSERDIGVLASDPPLSFYVLFEAAHDMGGRRLGALGSLILAETLYRALQSPQWSDAPGETDTGCEFSKLARDVYGQTGCASKITRIASCVPDIKTMPDLLAFLAPTAERAELALPFL